MRRSNMPTARKKKIKLKARVDTEVEINIWKTAACSIRAAQSGESLIHIRKNDQRPQAIRCFSGRACKRYSSAQYPHGAARRRGPDDQRPHRHGRATTRRRRCPTSSVPTICPGSPYRIAAPAAASPRRHNQPSPAGIGALEPPRNRFTRSKGLAALAHCLCAPRRRYRWIPEQAIAAVIRHRCDAGSLRTR